MSTVDSPERGAATLEGPPPKILVIQAPYYRAVVDGMRDGAQQVFSTLKAQVDVSLFDTLLTTLETRRQAKE